MKGPKSLTIVIKLGTYITAQRNMSCEAEQKCRYELYR
jgi:hypothetical protein